MNNKTKVVYVLTKSNEDLDITYPIGVFSNIDLAIKKVLDGVLIIWQVLILYWISPRLPILRMFHMLRIL